MKKGDLFPCVSKSPTLHHLFHQKTLSASKSPFEPVQGDNPFPAYFHYTT